ncbi:MAG: ACT domain-containing protein, partial [Blastocatellia bacterium]
DFTTLIEVIVKNDKDQCRVAGTIVGKGELRIVAIDSYRLDAAPEGQMLILKNGDQPGVVGRVGTFLGDHRINIAQLYLSRNKAGGTAIAVYQVDSALDAATLAELAKSEHVISVKQISL